MVLKKANDVGIKIPEVIVTGTYRNTMKGTHYYNSKTQNWIFKDSNGQFHTGWRLGNNQRQDLLINGNVQ